MKPEDLNQETLSATPLARSTQGAPPVKSRELNSTELLSGQQEIFIRHGEELYRLRVTRNGKLILHK